MKTIIAGTRNANRTYTFEALNHCGFVEEITEVVSGGCPSGADRWGEDFAIHYAECPVKRFEADWRAHGRAAGPIRNRQMAQYADALIAVWDGESRGTKNMIDEARKQGLRVYVHRFRWVQPSGEVSE